MLYEFKLVVIPLTVISLILAGEPAHTNGCALCKRNVGNPCSKAYHQACIRVSL